MNDRLAQAQGLGLLIHLVKLLPIAADDAAEGLVRELFQLRQGVQQEEEALFRRVARQDGQHELTLADAQLRTDGEVAHGGLFRLHAVVDDLYALRADAVLHHDVPPLAADGDDLVVARGKDTVEHPPLEAAADGQVVSIHHLGRCVVPQGEQGDDVLARVLRVYYLDFMLPAVGGQLLCRGEGVAVQLYLEAGHAARGQLLRQLARDIVGEAAVVIGCGEDADEILDVFFRPRLARKVYEKEYPQLVSLPELIPLII